MKPNKTDRQLRKAAIGQSILKRLRRMNSHGIFKRLDKINKGLDKQGSVLP